MNNILIIGGSSQARIVIKMIEELGLGQIKLIYDPTIQNHKFRSDINFTNNYKKFIEDVKIYKINCYHVCIGNEFGYARTVISRILNRIGLKPINIISRESMVDDTVLIGDGKLIMPGAIIQKYSNIGKYCIVNSGSIIEHEVLIGTGVHIMSGAVITGRVKIEDYCTIGANSTILPDLIIKKGSIIGAGAVVLKNTSPFEVVVGNPSRHLRINKLKKPKFK
jgi:sugar O-acyltransferase (sialic acid O-acetyltransferase NeuD family)